MNNTRFGFLSSAIAIGTMVSQIPGGMFSDRFGVRKVMSWGFLTIGTFFFLFSLSNVFLFSAVLLFVLGLGTGCIQVSGVKAIIDWFPSRGRATAMGIKQTGINVGGMLSSILFSFLIYKYSWRFLVECVSSVAFIFGFFFFFLYRDSLSTENGSSYRKFHFRDTLIFLKDINFITITLSGSFLIIAQFSFLTYVILYLNQFLQYSMELSGTILALSFGTGALARVGWSIVSDYFLGKRESILILIGGMGAFVIILLGFTTPSTPLWFIYFLSISFGITGMGWNAVWFTVVGEFSMKESSGLGIGLSYFIASFGIILGPLFFGFLTDISNSFLLSWFFTAFCMVISSLLILWKNRTFRLASLTS
jgi:MFS family permease